MSESSLEPEISGLRFYVDAFYELSSCRSIGMALGPIPFTAILEYSKIFYDGEFDDFLYFMRVMDREYLKLAAEASKPKPQTGKK